MSPFPTRWLSNFILRMSCHRDPIVRYASIGLSELSLFFTFFFIANLCFRLPERGFHSRLFWLKDDDILFWFSYFAQTNNFQEFKESFKKRSADVTMRRGCDRPEEWQNMMGKERGTKGVEQENLVWPRCSALKSTNVKYEERERERRDVLSSFYQIVRHIGDNFFGKYLFCRAKMKLHAATF